MEQIVTTRYLISLLQFFSLSVYNIFAVHISYYNIINVTDSEVSLFSLTNCHFSLTSCVEENRSYQEHKGLLPYQNVFSVNSLCT